MHNNVTGVGEILIFGCCTLYVIVMYLIQLSPGDLFMFFEMPKHIFNVPWLAAFFCITSIYLLDGIVKEAFVLYNGEFTYIKKSES